MDGSANVRSEQVAQADRSNVARKYLIWTSIYLLLVCGVQFWLGHRVGPDTVILFLLFAAIVTGSARTFLRDWIPFVALFFGWIFLRGYADQTARGAGFKVHGADVIAAERWLFGGKVPTVELQQLFFTPRHLHWYDYVASTFYGFHFVLPLLFAYLLWIRDRGLYWRFVLSLSVLTYAGFVTYVLFPTLPPWLAAKQHLVIENGEPVRIAMVRTSVLRSFGGLGGLTSVVIERANPNPIAAMPSLHAAFPTMVFLFSLVHWRRLAPFALVYCFGLWLSIVYLGEHWVVDALAGIAYAVVAYCLVEGIRAVRARQRVQRTKQVPAPERA
ncbi:MAG: phosphatase PAP2 family protein [Chloroflexota bacterium]|nr:phosphatase PAP2 family protein [Chloroflexota bacterium]